VAFTGTYSAGTTAFTSVGRIYTTTGGGTVFSSNLYNTAAFDFFSDTAVVDDAMYFSTGVNQALVSGLRFNVGTAIAATSITLVWEYYKRTVTTAGVTSYVWATIECLQDDTNGFTTTGLNFVRFPQQWMANALTNLNGNSGEYLWVRCRISAVSGLTEGGANTTNAITYGNGVLTISGTTEGSPATFKDVADWIATNKSYITGCNPSYGVYDFTKVGLVINSPLLSTSEYVDLGPGCYTNNNAGLNALNYLITGVKEGKRGYNGSVFTVHGTVNSQVCSLSASSKIYGACFRRSKYASGIGANPGYFSIQGEIVDSSFECSPYPSAGTFTNIKLAMSSFLLLGNLTSTFDGFIVINTTGTAMFWQYGANTGWTITGFDWNYGTQTGGIIVYFYRDMYRASPTLNLVNPVTPLGSMSDSFKPCGAPSPANYAINYLKKYTASTGTYTNYTTEAGNATADDVPLGGEVGDMIYFGVSDRYYYTNFYLEKTTATNDYVYEWEYYYGGAWISIGATNMWDGTDNMSKTGYFLSCCHSPQLIASTTVDGDTAYWYRARITAKGTGSPVATRIRKTLAYGIGNWVLNQKYTIDLKIVDEDGSAISGATVTANYSDGTQAFSVTTAVDGTITQQSVINKYFKIDPTATTTYFMAGTDLSSDFSIKILKNGYETYSETISFTEQIDKTVALKQSRDIMYSTRGQVFAKVDATNNTEDRELLIPITE